MTVKQPRPLDPFEEGFFVGILVGEGHFGGDGRQPQVTLRMHTRHEALFRWLDARFPRCRLYGPYHHGGRSYYQWMARGEGLVRDVLPVLDASLGPALDGYAAERYAAMCRDYATFIAAARRRIALLADADGSPAGESAAPGVTAAPAEPASSGGFGAGGQR